MLPPWPSGALANCAGCAGVAGVFAVVADEAPPGWRALKKSGVEEPAAAPRWVMLPDSSMLCPGLAALNFSRAASKVPLALAWSTWL